MGNSCKGATARLKNSCQRADDLQDNRRLQRPHAAATPNAKIDQAEPSWEPAPVAPTERISIPEPEYPRVSEDFLKQSRPMDTVGMINISLEGVKVPHSTEVWLKTDASVGGLREV